MHKLLQAHKIFRKI